MHIAFDLDGTLDTDKANLASLCAALRSAGHRVSVVTGCSRPVPTKQDVKDKIGYLRSLGFDDLWDTLVVIGDPPHATKAKWVKENGVDALFDNSVQNAKLCSEVTRVYLPWNTKQD